MTLIGSLCTGTGALDMAVKEVFGGTVAWHCQYEPPDKQGREDKHQYAARILAHHWPDVPNHGDITAVDWTKVQHVNVITAGFPCKNLSAAGQRGGIVAGTPSGLWLYVVQAIAEIRPDWVVIENVEGILSAPADRGVGPTDADVEAAGRNALRALGCVLGDLAALGFDAEWVCVPASRIGAPHQRKRVFILAWPANAPRPGLEGERLRGRIAERGGDAAADPAHLGHQRSRDTRQRRPGPADGHLAAADTSGDGRQWGEECHLGQEAGLEAPLRDDAERRLLDWGQYGPAIRRWERILGRPAPAPTMPGASGKPRLSPWFTEWMMGLPKGHVCDVPAPKMTGAGLRNARLKATGNGVVPDQAAYALSLLRARARRAVTSC